MLLNCERLRVDVDGAVLVEDLTCAVDGHWLALVGDVTALAAALSGRGRVVHGSLKVTDVDGRAAVASGVLGLALGEARFNPRWTALELLAKSGLLTGLTEKEARERALGVLARLGLPWLGLREMGRLSRCEFVALELCKALLTEPGVVFVQAPLRGLTSADADWLWPLVERAGHGRSLIVGFDAPLFAEERARLARFERLVFLHQGRVTATGTPDEMLTFAVYLVSVMRGGTSLRQALEERGAKVLHFGAEAGDDQPSQLLVTSEHSELAQWIARDAVDHDVPVIELVPLTGSVRND